MKTEIEFGVNVSQAAEPSSWSIRGQMAHASRRDRATPLADLQAMKRDYVAAKIAEYVEAEVRKIPPLTDEQISRISRAMRGTTATG